MSEADWTPSPRVERTAASLRRRARWEGSLSVWIADFFSVGATFSLALLPSAFSSGSILGIVLSIVSIVTCGKLVFWLAKRDHDLLTETKAVDRARREEFGAGAGWIVDLIVLQGDAPTGKDRGMLWIEDGRLCFSGDRTSFALSNDQVVERCQNTRLISGLRYTTRLSLAHRTGAGPLALSIRAEVLDHEVVRSMIDLWSLGASSGGQFPPTRVGPGEVSPGKLFAVAVFGTVHWTLAALLTAWAFERSLETGAFVLVVALFGGAVLGCLPVRTRWRAWAHRRRLEKSNLGR